MSDESWGPEDWKELRRQQQEHRRKRFPILVKKLDKLAAAHPYLKITWLTEHQVRIRRDSEYLDFYPSTAVIVHKGKNAGHGIKLVLKLLGIRDSN